METRSITDTGERIIVDMDTCILPKYKFQNFQFNIITDVWLCGPACKDSQGNKFDGAYPAGFLDRMKSGFYHYYPVDKREILFVCSGRVPSSEGMRLDIDPKYNPDFPCNAENMDLIRGNTFSWTTSDTPYNKDASDKYYGKPLLNKSKCLKEMSRVTKVNGFVSVLDESFPVSPPRNLKCVARIAVSSVPNLTFRAFTVFKKVSE